jgi:hypothetical protein
MILIPLSPPVSVSHSPPYSSRYVITICYVFTSRCLITDLNNVLCLRAHVLTGWRLLQLSALKS